MKILVISLILAAALTVANAAPFATDALEVRGLKWPSFQEKSAPSVPREHKVQFPIPLVSSPDHGPKPAAVHVQFPTPLVSPPHPGSKPAAAPMQFPIPSIPTPYEPYHHHEAALNHSRHGASELEEAAKASDRGDYGAAAHHATKGADHYHLATVAAVAGGHLDLEKTSRMRTHVALGIASAYTEIHKVATEKPYSGPMISPPNIESQFALASGREGESESKKAADEFYRGNHEAAIQHATNAMGKHNMATRFAMKGEHGDIARAQAVRSIVAQRLVSVYKAHQTNTGVVTSEATDSQSAPSSHKTL